MTFGAPTEISIKKAKYISKSFKLADGGSMYLLVDTFGKALVDGLPSRW